LNKENKNIVDWSYRELSHIITKSRIALEMKFLLLTLIDLQLGKIDASQLSFFRACKEEL